MQQVAYPSRRVPPAPPAGCSVWPTVPLQDPGGFLYKASKLFAVIYCLPLKLITLVFNNDGLLSSEKPRPI